MSLDVLDHFIERLALAPQAQNLLQALAISDNNLVINGVRAGGEPALLAVLARRLKRPLLVVTTTLERAESIVDGLEFFGERPLIFPGFETLPFETTEPVLHATATRWEALARLALDGATSAPPVIVAPIDALAFRTLAAADIRELVVKIEWGEPLNIDRLAERLVAMGYRREALVESPGEFAVRGSIIDIYPPDAEWPWRLDLFGDDLEQIRQFDPTTQRSRQLEHEIERLRILPAASHAPALDRLAHGKLLASFFDLLPEGTLLINDGASRIEQRLLHFNETTERHWQDVQKTRKDEEPNFFTAHHLQPPHWLLSPDEIRASMERLPWVNLADLNDELDAQEAESANKRRSVAGKRSLVTLPFATHSFETIPSQFPQYVGLIRERLRKGHWVVIVCDNNGQLLRLDELLRENEISAAFLMPVGDRPAAPPTALPRSPGDASHDVLLAIGALHEGFYSLEAGVMIVTDREIFGRYKRRHIYRKASRGKAVANPNEIERGDFVVHVQHGIGLFEGIRRQQVDGRAAELLELTYQDGDKLLVPVEKLHMIQKYAGADGKQPTLDKLGSKKWQKRCHKSVELVRKMAGELLELYARRAGAEGYAYGPDTVWQREFEASFVYQETPDQLTAIQQVKKDMENHKPMDRLVCGDVGYGKTEVAIRAAFKALVEGRQVALLAPTTLLVSQHFNNFRERYAGYPFKVAMLSRFLTPGEAHKAIAGLETGEVQMIIGTHRLLSKDVRFKDLGLLIVDEEQRFGVAQKEKIKSLRSEVDIVTLSATPIPRTLYMALSGLRDLSIITTPPADRLPIKTRTIRFDREILEEAILRELNRGGQVYIIHNRIQSIQEIAKTIHEIVPRARIAIGHGQMDEHELEKLMVDFIDGKFDILISTTIIENGIDIPNVNTIIINRADAFGLSQLYQLRGRVGRDVRQAYAYLILPPGQAITPAAVKRLEALEEFTDLGVGFSIAMRDLEIRGTGNILGRDQHGAINDIGYEMYCRLLEDAVQEMRGSGPIEPIWPTEVKWPVDQLLPEEYIPIESQRIRFYKDIAGARDQSDLDRIQDELLDRYGVLPVQAVNMLNATRLRLAGAAWRVDVIRLIGDAGEEGTPAEWKEVRVKSPVSHIELAVALAERAEVGRSVFSRLRKSGDTLILMPREIDHPFSADQILSATADWFEALPAFEENLKIQPAGDPR